MTPAQDHIVDLVLSSTGPICDDCLARQLQIEPRQKVNQHCRRLAQRGQVSRTNRRCTVCGDTKLTNWRHDVAAAIPSPSDREVAVPATVRSSPLAVAEKPNRPWYWEGHVQARIAAYLVEHGWTINHTANTATREAGKDIVARRAGRELWVSVKGYPTPKQSTHTQARHWFSHALFDLVLYRGENPDVQLGIGLPDGYVTYHALARRVSWFQEQLPFQIYWVAESGTVRES